IKALCIGRKDRENQKWNKKKNTGHPVPGLKLRQHPCHQRRRDSQKGPLNKQQRLRFWEQGLSPRKQIITKRSCGGGEVHVRNLPHSYALGSIKIDVAIPI